MPRAGGGQAAPEFRVAVGNAEDLVPFVELLEAAASWLWQRGIHQWEPGSMRAQSPILSRFAQSSGLVVARSAGGLAGGCCLVPDPAPEWAGRAGDALYLHKLVVARPYAGQGLAHRLLAFCEERARAGAIVRLRLDCWDGNAKLRAFYRAAGFRELEAVPSFGYSVRLFERELE